MHLYDIDNEWIGCKNSKFVDASEIYLYSIISKHLQITFDKLDL